MTDTPNPQGAQEAEVTATPFFPTNTISGKLTEPVTHPEVGEILPEGAPIVAIEHELGPQLLLPADTALELGVSLIQAAGQAQALVESPDVEAEALETLAAEFPGLEVVSDEDDEDFGQYL